MTKNVKFDFTDQVVIVTGGGSGIGEGIVIKFAEAGAKVIICDYDEKNGKRVADEQTAAGYKAEFYKIDVGDPAACVALKDFIMEKYGRLDVLCSNAGVSPGRDPETGRQYVGPPLTNIAYSDWERQFRINLMGGVNLCVAFRQVWVDQKFGKIVFTSSINGYLPKPLEPQYGSMKIGLIYFAQCFAKEMGEYNINVNCICPGYVHTAMYKEGGMTMKDLDPVTFKDAQNTEDIVKKLGEIKSALRRPQTAEDLANAAAFLASDAACEITGQVINVDSGQTMR